MIFKRPGTIKEINQNRMSVHRIGTFLVYIFFRSPAAALYNDTQRAHTHFTLTQQRRTGKHHRTRTAKMSMEQSSAITQSDFPVKPVTVTREELHIRCAGLEHKV